MRFFVILITFLLIMLSLYAFRYLREMKRNIRSNKPLDKHKMVIVFLITLVITFVYLIFKYVL